MNKVYMCIDLKSFYASVECVERKLNPLTTNLVVADSSRTEKTICLAVSPSLKSYGIPGRARLFEVVQKVKEINYERRKKINFRKFSNKSYDNNEILNNHNLELSYVVAPPRMALYINYSTRIYNVYLKYLSPDDIFVYSIDEVFCDITNYLKYYQMTPTELVTKIINDVLKTTGITATAGIGTNLYLAKVAMDIEAKHVNENKDGVRIAYLDEMLYRKKLWNHKPLTDFWRVGKGYCKKLEENKIYTMGDVARTSLNNEELLYKLFGVNAETLIDHAWGYEPCTMKDIKSYKPMSNSISSGQVLHCPYNFNKAKLIVREMVDLLTLELVDKKLVTNQIILTIGYESLNENSNYDGYITTDYYGRLVPKHAHGTANLKHKTASTKLITDSVMKLYEEIVNPKLLIKRINIVANNVVNESIAEKEESYEQLDLFMDYEKIDKQRKEEKIEEKEEKNLQSVMIDIKKKFGKNAIVKAMDLEEGATTIERNNQIGGHKAS